MTEYAKVKSLARWQDWEKGHSASESGSRRTLTLFVIKTSVSLGKAIGGRQASGWDFNSDFFYILCIRWIVNTFTMEIALQELHSNFSWAEELYLSLWVCLSVIGKGSPFLKCFVFILAFFHLFFPCQNELKCVHTILAIFLHHLVSVLSLFSASNGIVWKVWGDEEKNSFERGFTSFHHKGKYSMGTFVVLWYWSNCPESSDLELC